MCCTKLSRGGRRELCVAFESMHMFVITAGDYMSMAVIKESVIRSP